jgi:hypothetical protein
VALKLLKNDSAEALREGRLLAKLRHGHVVAVHGAEVHDGRTGLWMELIRGRSLEQVLRHGGPLGAREAALVGIDLCRRARRRARRRRAAPGRQGRERAARGRGPDPPRGLRRRPGPAHRRRRRADALRARRTTWPPSCSPEPPPSERADLYALGVLLYRLVTASFPVQAVTWEELRAKHARRESTLLRDRRPDLPEAFVAAVERATASDPAQRFATAGQMEQALAATLGAAPAGPSPAQVEPAPRKSPILFILLGVLLVAAGVLLASYLRRKEPASIAVPPPIPAVSPPAVAAATYTVEAALWRVPARGHLAGTARARRTARPGGPAHAGVPVLRTPPRLRGQRGRGRARLRAVPAPRLRGAKPPDARDPPRPAGRAHGDGGARLLGRGFSRRDASTSSCWRAPRASPTSRPR